MSSYSNPDHLTALPDPEHYPQVYAGVLAKRFIAWIVDSVIIGLFSAVALPFTAFTGVFFFPALMLTIGFFYRWFTLASESGTWGMRLAGMELRQHDGTKFESDTAFWHTMGYSLSVVFAPVQFVSVLVMFLSPRRQGLTDHVMGTAPVNRLRS